MPKLLEVNDLRVSFFTDQGELPAVDGIDFHVNRDEILGVVGESGCGKSVTSLSIMRLLQPPGRIVAGSIKWEGEDLLLASERRMREARGNEIAMVFQEPMTSLNPVFTIGNQLIEGIRLGRKITKRDARQRAISLLRQVGIPRSEQIIHEYPHRLSGGMRQRAMIAMAISRDPKLLIADEPTTALDVTVQAEILALLKSLNEKAGAAIMMITHDLGVVAEICDRVIVMYAGKVVEEADTRSIFRNPRHPYTYGLLQSAPRLDREWDRLPSIPGQVPPPGSIQTGCRFAPRCSIAEKRCYIETPTLASVESGHKVRCWLRTT